jgi:RNA polymerase sporulation-specific sigma factor
MSDLEYTDDPVQVYLREACAVPPLTHEEEIECVRRLRAGDQKAELRLLEANLTMVGAIAERYGNEQVHVLNLIIEGNNALMGALKTFDETSSGTFTEYAAAAVERAIAEKSL